MAERPDVLSRAFGETVSALKAHGVRPAGTPFAENCLTDPESESHPSMWSTEICWSLS